MRVLVATLVLMSCAGSAAAQSALAPLPPLPPIGLPLPEITAPLAPVGLPPATTGFERPPVTRRPGGGSPHKPRRPHRFPTVVYLVDSYYWPGMEGARSATAGCDAGETN